MILLIAFAGAVAAGVHYVRKFRAERHRQRLASQLRQSLQGMIHALRVGVSFSQALDYAAQEGAQPLAAEWTRVLQAVRMGQSLSEALQELAIRIPIKEMEWFVAAVQIVQGCGGSLAEVLDTLAATLQERETLREKVAALTAQGKATGILLSLLPFFVAGAMELIAPDIVSPLFTTMAGQAMLAGVIASITAGSFVIQKIVTLPVE